MSEQRSTSPSVVRGVRRAAIIAIIGSLVIAAILGIIALLSGEFGEVQGKVLVTTLTVAAFGTTALCHLATVSRQVRVVGFVGIAASAIAAACALVLIWMPWDANIDTEWLWKGLGLAGVAAVSLAQANLLLLLAGRQHPVIRTTLWVTLGAVAIVAVMIWLPIMSEGEIPGQGAEEAYWRFFGVVAIIDALGTIALPILGLVLRGVAPATTAPVLGGTGASAVSEPGLTLTVPEELAAELHAHAERTGMSVQDAALTILRAGIRS